MAPSSSDPNAIRAVLTKPQRTALPRLVNNITAQMRSSIEHSFETTDPESSNLFQQQHQDEWETEPSARASHSDADERDRQISESLENRLSKPKMERLKRAALRYFDDWQWKVMSRLGEVVHSQEAPPYTPRPVPAQSQTNEELEEISIREAEDLSVLRELYYPLPTKFSTLPKDVRVILISSMLLLLLSLGHYSAHSRVLLLHLTSSFELPLSILTNEETEIARSLLLASKELTADAETQKRQEENKTARRWKVGLASVAGAAVIGITGGLAAPIVAGGIGALMGGVGLGGLASFLGIFAMNGALVGTLFGAFGGKMTGSMVDAYAKEVEDFKFLPIKDEWGIAKKEDEDNDRRLRVTIGINGWLTKKDDVIKPWRSMGQATEVFALRYEMDALIELGTSLKSMVSSYAWSYVKVEILKRTVLASLWSALWPVYLLKMATSIDNPFGLARTRSEKAGEVLADALINKAQGERPVTLIGYSLGARVIYSCLMSLAERNAFGLVESVVFIGAPIPSNADNWRVMRSVVSGVMANVYSENDYILAFLYRATSIQFGVAGLQAIKDVEGITNLDLSKDVSGHLRYPDLIGKILKRVGGIDVRVENANIESEVVEKEILLIDIDDDVALAQLASRGEALNLKDKRISGDKDLLRMDDSSRGGQDKLKDTKHNINDEETKPENYDEESDDDRPLQLVDNDPEEDDDGPLQLVEAEAVPEDIAELSAETRHTVQIEDSPEEQKVVFPRDEQKSLASMPKEPARRVRASDLGLY